MTRENNNNFFSALLAGEPGKIKASTIGYIIATAITVISIAAALSGHLQTLLSK
jgi:hypothetical protein